MSTPRLGRYFYALGVIIGTQGYLLGGGLRVETAFKMVAAGAGAITGYLFGGWTALLGVLLTFVLLDYLTGMLASGVEGRLSSGIGMIGIAKKVGIFIIVAAGHLADTAIGDGHIIRDAAIFFYMANELLSIIENAGRIGLPVPSAIQQAVEVLKSKGDGK